MTTTAEGLSTILADVPNGTKTYALMDCALDSTLYPTVQSSGCAYQCLYDDQWQSGLADVAPYLVALDPKSKFSTELLNWDWYANWGYFTQSSAALTDCAQALKAVTTAQLPDGTNTFFRFQDPRVLRVFLESASPDDLKAVFGKATRLIVPMADDGRQAEGAIVYTLSDDTLKQTETRFGG